MDAALRRALELRQHRHSWLAPWRCSCGFRRPCPQRQLLLDEQLREAARAAVEWYPVYFARYRRQP